MIRKATSADIAQAAEIFKQLHNIHVEAKPDSFRTVPADFFRSRLQEYLLEENTGIFVNDEGGINAFAVVKVLAFNAEDEERFPRRCCYINCFAVDESCRRQGVGRELMEYIKKYAKENNCNTIQLGVSGFNKQAREFYQAMGFAERSIAMEQKIE